jgi:hypothetical protein
MSWSTQDKLAWIEQLVTDGQLSALALRVGLILAVRYINAKNGSAWPSQSRLASELGATPDGIRRAVRVLEAGGHVEVQRGRGAGISSRFRPVLKPRRPSGLSRPESQTPVGLFDEKTPTACRKNPDARSEKTPARVGPNPLKEPSEEPIERERPRRRAPATAIPEGFPTEADLDAVNVLAASLGVDARDQGARFRDHALEHDRQCRDWGAALRNWIRKAPDFRPRPRARQRPHSHSEEAVRDLFSDDQ